MRVWGNIMIYSKIKGCSEQGKSSLAHNTFIHLKKIELYLKIPTFISIIEKKDQKSK